MQKLKEKDLPITKLTSGVTDDTSNIFIAMNNIISKKKFFNKQNSVIILTKIKDFNE